MGRVVAAVLALAMGVAGAAGISATAFAQDLASFEKRTTVKVLPNGLTLIICERPEAPVFSFYTLVDAGSADDPQGASGLAHMFEHIAFKGTNEIGTTNYPAEKVALANVEVAYAAYDAEFRKMVGKDPAKLAELKKVFEDAQAAAEKYVVPNQFAEMAEQNGAVGLNASTEADAFHKKYYVPANIVIAVVGDVKAADAMPILTKYFGAIPAGPKPEPMTTIEPEQFAEKSVIIKEPTQPFYLEGYHRPDYRDPDDSVYDAITDIFSNGRTARLYKSLVRDQQIAADAEGFSGFPGDKYPGLFAFYGVPVPGHTPEEIRVAIHKEIDKLKAEDVTDEELQTFKTRARADLLRGLADNEGLAHQLAEYQTRYGDWRQLFRELDDIDKVTKADVRRVANKIFVESNRTSARIEFAAPDAAAPQTGGAK
jgi:predicted Zn-dependent peptidase